MANLSINLLPQELTAEKKQRQKAATVVQISVVILVLIIVAAGIVLSFRFAQNAQLTKTQSQITTVKQEINSPENHLREGLVVTLGSRLDSINQAGKTDYPASYAFNMVARMLPANVLIQAFTLDRKGKATVQLVTPDTAVMSKLLDNLMDPAKNNQKIDKASIESIALNKSGHYDVSMTVNFTGGATK